MSRGPGKVERAIEAAFLASPEATFSVADLGPIAYPGLNRVEKRHRVAILRAADRVAARLWWKGLKSERPGGAIVYCNLLNVRSYTLGRMRVDLVDGTEPLWRLESLLEPPQFGDPWKHRNQWDRIQPGGSYWLHVEMAKAQKAGDFAEYERLRAALRESVNRRIAAMYPDAYELSDG
ncbi:hypothetical protein [Methylobacterium sp. E-046]|uniref:hypothetical protein n=1 Tax=Methylobacterium sp. E-046 TaxID=2836576 RepID=UPI001FB8770E|nr:hypothetical protein [Methylobacterium sp. E-046]MCJ2099717.1 hypothetical protein [Methylobacterium sp. E-046]